MTPIKRPNYFKGQFLRADDFNDEQKYHMRMRRLHNSTMHTWGVVAGLEVAAAATGVKVTAGSAVDKKEGKEIWLLDETSVPSPAGDGDYYIVISYKEVLDERYGDENKYIRWLETGELSWVPAMPPPADDADLLKLARVTVSGGKVTPQIGPPPNPDNSVRRTASTLHANSNGDIEIRPVSKDGSLRLMTGSPLKESLTIDAGGRIGIGNGIVGKLEIKGAAAGASVKFGGGGGDVHHLSCGRDLVFNSQPGHFLFRKTTYTDLSSYEELVTITPEGALLVKGKIASGGTPGVAAPIPEHALTIQGGGATYLNVKVSGGPEVLVGADSGGGVVSARTNHDLQLKAGNDTTRMIIKKDGNVGIGLTEPKSRLDINGQLRVRESSLVFADASGTVYPGNWIGMDDKVDEQAKTRWLRIGGISGTDQVRRLTLQAEITHISGRIGIGTPTPAAALQVGSGNSVVAISDEGNIGVGTSVTGKNRLRISRPLGGNDVGKLQHEFQLEIRSGIGNKALAIGLLDNGNGVIQAKEVNVGYNHLLLNPVEKNVGIGTSNPRARLDVGDVTPNTFKSILARLGEGDDKGQGTSQGTFLGVKAYSTQPDVAGGDPKGVVSFAIEHYFYGNRNGFIQFNRGGDSSTGFLTLSQGWKAQGSDLAESFEAAGQIKPGDVVVFDERQGLVKSCEREADSCVVGVASTEPAGILGTDGGNSTPIALCGRVPCNVDADIAPIRTGDLLTTSPTRGHAQKVLDAKRAAGAIIGKALGSLEKGRGAITVLVALA